MLSDVQRLDERVGKLAKSLNQVERDINDIQISSRKIISRGKNFEIEVVDTLLKLL